MTSDDATDPGTELSVPDPADHPLPFEGLQAPEPIDATPPTGARVLAMGSILLGGLLGGLIGFGIGDALGSVGTETVQGADGSENWSARNQGLRRSSGSAATTVSSSRRRARTAAREGRAHSAARAR